MGHPNDWDGILGLTGTALHITDPWSALLQVSKANQSVQITISEALRGRSVAGITHGCAGGQRDACVLHGLYLTLAGVRHGAQLCGWWAVAGCRTKGDSDACASEQCMGAESETLMHHHGAPPGVQSSVFD